ASPCQLGAALYAGRAGIATGGGAGMGAGAAPVTGCWAWVTPAVSITAAIAIRRIGRPPGVVQRSHYLPSTGRARKTNAGRRIRRLAARGATAVPYVTAVSASCRGTGGPPVLRQVAPRDGVLPAGQLLRVVAEDDHPA